MRTLREYRVLNRGDGGGHARVPAVVRSAGKSAPLTFQQQWAVNHWMPLGNLYVVGSVIRLGGPLHSEILSKSLDVVVQRHDALRTRLVSVNEVLEQQVDEHGERPLEVIDLSDTPEVGCEDEAQECVGELIRKPCDLARDSPANFALVRLGERMHLLVCVIQHIVCDYISMGVFLEELWRVYGDCILGRSSSISAIPLQYSDYAIRQRSEDARWLAEHEGYWKLILAGASRVRLPYDEGLDGVAPFSGGYVQTSFSALLSSALRSLARMQQVTVATVMLTIYAIVLWRWSGQEDFVIPFAVPGRCGAMQMKMIGQLAEFLPLRVGVEGDETLAAMLRRVSELVVTACRHLDCGRIVINSPEFFCGTSLNCFPNSASRLGVPDWRGRRECPTLEWFACKFPGPLEYCGRLSAEMGCRMVDVNECIVASIRYRADLFSSASMGRFLGDLKEVAERVVRDPGSRVAVTAFGKWMKA